MIRRALEQDVAAIGNTYTELLRHEEEHGSSSNWRLGEIGRAHV